MVIFRHKILVGLFFMLISLGQAYPFAAVYAAIQEHQCVCNQMGHKCIHGCDLKKGSHRGHHRHMDHELKYSSAEDQWVSPDCARQKMQKIFSFQTESYLLNPGWSLRGPPARFFSSDPPAGGPGLLLSCEDPPPKGDEPPEDPV